MLDSLKEYKRDDEKNTSEKETFLSNIQNFYIGREMVIDAFINKKIPSSDGSYSQHLERETDEEADIYWMEHPEKFEDSLNTIKKG